jgi:hypothetical protein
MKQSRFFSVLLVGLFLATVGMSKVYSQDMEYNFKFSSTLQGFVAMPDGVDKDSLSEEDRLELEDLEFEEDFCLENELTISEWVSSFLLALDKEMLISFLEENEFQVEELDGLIMGIMEEDEIITKVRINLDELTYEEFVFGEEDNPFFGEENNKIIEVLRVSCTRIDEQIIPVEETNIEYGELPSGIPYERTYVTTYLFYERIDENGSTIVKVGDEEAYNECIGEGSQEMATMNYFARVQSAYAIPNRIDQGTLTAGDIEELEDEEFDFEDCFENEDDIFLEGSLAFEMEKADLIIMLLNEGYSSVSMKGNVLIADGHRVQLTIDFNELIFEVRDFGWEDNPFFDTAGNKTEGIMRMNFKQAGNRYAPEKLTFIEYRQTEESEIPYEVTRSTTYLYYERIDEDGNTVLKTGDEELYNDCMLGIVRIKEIQQPQHTDINIYPNPAKEQITIAFNENENVDIKIINMLGINVLSQQAKGDKVTIDVNSLPAGVYIVRCAKNEKVTSTRFIKQ